MAEVSRAKASEVLSAALKYASRSWPVFPLHSITVDGHCTCSKGRECEPKRAGKHPRTKKGLLDASTNPEVIKGWWNRWPDSNVGVRTGNGLMVLDIDPERDGDESLAELEQLHGPAPETLTALTGGGGQHLYFHTKLKVQCAVDNPGPGLDVRGHGGYVVAPPSLHASGRYYAWDLGQGAELAQMPAWMMPMKRAHVPTPEAEADAAVVAGRRNSYLASYAGKLRRMGTQEPVLRAALMAENIRRCRPPLDEGEVVRIARSICRYPSEGVLELTDDHKPEWYSLLRMTGKDNSKIKHSPGNATILLCHRQEWKDVLRFNEFSGSIEWAQDAPMGGGPGRPRAGEDFQEHHLGYVTHWLCRFAGPDFSKDAVCTGLEVAAREHTVHPVREYLDSLKWDGRERVGDWLTNYLGVARTVYTQAVGQWWLISAVARIMRPGCQADHMLVLEGQQGVGKSTAARTLAGPWYLGGLPDLRSKDCGHALQGNWIVEVGELDAFRGVGATRVKEYLSQVVDAYRPAYARLFVRRPRQCVFIGTTNETVYLDDTTGGRRFWPVKTTGLDRGALIRDRDQLWAEALTMLNEGAQWWPTKELVLEIQREQEERNRVDPWEEKITKWVEHREYVTILELLTDAIAMDLPHIEQRHFRRVTEIMRMLGWKTTRRMVDRQRERGFCRPNSSVAW